MVNEKLCLFCEHFAWENICEGGAYSTMTGGETYGGAMCRKGHYREDRPYDEGDLRVILLRAEKCPDYRRPAMRTKPPSP